MSIAERLLKPEYCFRPSQLLRRLRHFGKAVPLHSLVTQPWGLPIYANPREGVGRHLWDLGIIDLPVCEVIWRLLDPGENAVDVGANIGAITSLMAAKTGPSGSVWSFEPHPTIHAELLANVERWRATGRKIGQIQLSTKALSNADGTAELFEPEGFAENHGSASLERPATAPDPAAKKPGASFHIKTALLDEAIPANTRLSLMKMDVEGHELNVLLGAHNRLKSRAIRDIVFEDHEGYPSRTSGHLEALGYRVYLIDRTFWKPSLVAPRDSAPSVSWLPPNYLATMDPARAEYRCNKGGWDCLRG
jgi:FkbM family methyltransferase